MHHLWKRERRRVRNRTKLCLSTASLHVQKHSGQYNHDIRHTLYCQGIANFVTALIALFVCALHSVCWTAPPVLTMHGSTTHNYSCCAMLSDTIMYLCSTQDF